MRHLLPGILPRCLFSRVIQLHFSPRLFQHKVTCVTHCELDRYTFPPFQDKVTCVTHSELDRYTFPPFQHTVTRVIQSELNCCIYIPPLLFQDKVFRVVHSEPDCYTASLSPTPGSNAGSNLCHTQSEPDCYTFLL